MAVSRGKRYGVWRCYLLLAGAVAPFCPALAKSPDLQVTPQYAYEEPFAGFSARCPQQIIYRSTLNISLATHDADGAEIIVLDHSLQLPIRRFEHNFMAAHECAHHVLGDTTAKGIHARKTVRGVISQQELRADCWAAELMGVLGQDQDVNRMGESFYRRGNRLAGGGYPTGHERAVTLQKCWQKGRNQRLSAPEKGKGQY